LCQPEQDRHFDRRDVYLITQNALADPTYLDYIRAQYNRFEQNDPPFFQELLPTEFPSVFHEPTTLLKPLDYVFENLGAKIERRRRTGTSWFQESDFTNFGKLAAQLREGKDGLSKTLYGKLSQETQGLLGTDNRAAARALAKDFNTILNGTNLYSPDLFANVTLPPLILKAAKDDEHQTPSTRIRLNRRMLEEAYPGEIARSLGGVYPDTEIQEPSEQDSAQVYHDFYADAQRRLEHDAAHPNERKQVRDDEVVTEENGRLQITGQGAVMRINGLLTKIIFDRNPDHEFYVEESFPLEWMYPHLTPFSDIMKINRQETPVLSEEVVARDHAFWRLEAERSIGDWITYDTPVSNICDWCERVYVRHDYTNFTGDLKFIRDEDAQKSFSKLRNAVASSIYQWRGDNSEAPLSPPVQPPPGQAGIYAWHGENADAARKDPGVRQRMYREAEFALKQSFAFCPYSPEAVYHLMMLFYSQRRYEDIQRILQTCTQLDPYNGQFNFWLNQINTQLAGRESLTVQQALSQVQQAVQNKQYAQAESLLDQLTGGSQPDGGILVQCAQWYLQIGKPDKGTAAMQRLVDLAPTRWESWFYLARMQAVKGKAAAAAASLGRAFDLNPADRMDMPGIAITNLHEFAQKDPYFDKIRATPEYQKATAPRH
jgi:tetratricopeptide (TPR) repeat protein